jgi:hypothetical protein
MQPIHYSPLQSTTSARTHNPQAKPEFGAFPPESRQLLEEILSHARLPEAPLPVSVDRILYEGNGCRLWPNQLALIQGGSRFDGDHTLFDGSKNLPTWQNNIIRPLA